MYGCSARLEEFSFNISQVLTSETCGASARYVVVYGDGAVRLFALGVGLYSSRHHVRIPQDVGPQRSGAAVAFPAVSRQQKLLHVFGEIRDEARQGVCSQVEVAQPRKEKVGAVVRELAAFVVGQQQVLQILETGKCVAGENV